MSIRDTFLASVKLASEPVTVPEMGDGLTVREMTADERDVFDTRFAGKDADGERKSAKGFRAHLVVLTLCGPDGKRVFSDADAAAVGACPPRVLDKVVEVALRLNGFTAEEQEKLAGN